MKLVDTVAELRGEIARIKAPLGFVPTMGALHEGHLSLVRAARNDCAAVVMSIFVNPRQFGPGEDLEKYPRPFERDCDLAQQTGVDLLYAPTPREMYPKGYATTVSVAGLTETLCGASRPGHFDGVATVVAKLFHQIGPCRAYFGQKDAQQATMIERMILDLDLPVTLIVCPIVREDDGLAMSSRNVYLSPSERAQAPALRRALLAALQALHEGERNARALADLMAATFAAYPLVKPEYLALVDPKTLRAVEHAHGKVLVAVAARLGKTRLIDNAYADPGRGETSYAD